MQLPMTGPRFWMRILSSSKVEGPGSNNQSYSLENRDGAVEKSRGMAENGDPHAQGVDSLSFADVIKPLSKGL